MTDRFPPAWIPYQEAARLIGQPRGQVVWLAATGQISRLYDAGSNTLLISRRSLEAWIGGPLRAVLAARRGEFSFTD